MGQFRTQTLQTIRLAMPIVLGQLGIMLMGLADTIQVGKMPQLAAKVWAPLAWAIPFFLVWALWA